MVENRITLTLQVLTLSHEVKWGVQALLEVILLCFFCSQFFFYCRFVEGKKRKTQLELDAEDAALGKKNRATVDEVFFFFISSSFSPTEFLFFTALSRVWPSPNVLFNHATSLC